MSSLGQAAHFKNIKFRYLNEAFDSSWLLEQAELWAVHGLC